MIAAAWPCSSTCCWSPIETTAAGTPSWAVAASPAAARCRVSAALARWITTFAATSSAASPTSEPCWTNARTSIRAPSTTKKSGTKNPAAIPVI